MSEPRVQLLSGIFKDDTLSTDKFNCLYYAYNSSRTAFVSKKSRFSTLEEADSYLTTYNATFLSNLANDFDNVTVNSNSVAFSGTDYKFYNLDVTFSSSSPEIDYTNILTSINTNLTNLNTNIQNKNNQSDIVLCLENIFTQKFSNGSKNSIFKDSNANTDVEKANTNLCRLFRAVYTMLNNKDVGFSNLYLNNSNSILNDISKKLANNIPDVSDFNNKTILRVLDELSRKLSFDYPSSSGSDVSLYKQLLNIKGSLKDGSDLHTISQAIDLISTAIAQTPTTDTTNIEQGLTDIKTSIENKDNVLIVDGEQTFKFREKDS